MRQECKPKGSRPGSWYDIGIFVAPQFPLLKTNFRQASQIGLVRIKINMGLQPYHAMVSSLTEGIVDDSGHIIIILLRFQCILNLSS
jgi:hypothetical protein